MIWIVLTSVVAIVVIGAVAWWARRHYEPQDLGTVPLTDARRASFVEAERREDGERGRQ